MSSIPANFQPDLASSATESPSVLIWKQLKPVVRLFSSIGLGCVLFVLLLLLTFLGTLEQARFGLFETQKRYFESLIAWHPIGNWEVPLPGVYLLMILLSVNILLGGILRLRRRPSHIGLFIIHAGILFLLFGGLITFLMADDGQITLSSGQTASSFSSYHEWELVIVDSSPADHNREYIVPEKSFSSVGPGRQRLFRIAGLPYDLELSGYAKNARVVPGALSEQGGDKEMFISPLQPEKQAESNFPALSVMLKKPQTGEKQNEILWGGAFYRQNVQDPRTGVVRQEVAIADSRQPLAIDADGKKWQLSLRRRQWQFPFVLTLKKFTRELHPGTSKASNFQSDVILQENGENQNRTVRMNEPLRHRGYTFFQASFHEDPQTGALSSTFAVVHNPADHFPLYSLIIITFGMFLHFGVRLMQHLKTERAGRIMRTAASVSLMLIACNLFASAATNESVAETPWEEQTLAMFSRLPIQDDGRIKPLSTFATFKLVMISGRMRVINPSTEKNAKSVRVPAIYWLLDCLFRPESAKQYKVIRIENPEVMQALGLSDAKKRAHFRFSELESKQQTLAHLAGHAEQIPEKERTLFQNQVLNLYNSYVEYYRLLHALDAAMVSFDIAPDGELAKTLNANRNRGPRYTSILYHLPALAVSSARSSGNNAKEVQQILIRAEEAAANSTTLRIIPPENPADKEWLAPGTLFEQRLNGNKLSNTAQATMALLEQLVDQAGQPKLFAQTAGRLVENTSFAAMPTGQIKYLELEILFYKVSPFYWSLMLFIISFLLVGFTWLAPGVRWLKRLASVAVIVPSVVLVVGLVVRCVVRGRPPVTTLYETTLFVPAVAIVVALLIEWINRKGVALAVASFLGCFGLFFANSFELRGPDTMESMVAVLNSNFWLSTHVTTITIGYSAGLLACVMAHVYIFMRLFRRDPSKDALRSVSRMTYGVICFGALFSFVGTVLGGIWANYSWGRFWGWDPKENGALMIILWNLFILHGRFGGYLRDLGLAMAAVFGGMIVAFSWWGVNLLGIGLHSYGFLSGVQQVLYGYWIFEGIVLLAGTALAVLEMDLINRRREALTGVPAYKLESKSKINPREKKALMGAPACNRQGN